MARPGYERRNRLTIGPLGPSEDDVVNKRRQMWAGWLEDCATAQDTLVEGMLTLLPKEPS